MGKAIYSNFSSSMVLVDWYEVQLAVHHIPHTIFHTIANFFLERE